MNKRIPNKSPETQAAPEKVSLQRSIDELGAVALELSTADQEEAEDREHEHEHVGILIRELRTRQGLSIAELADKLGYSGPTVSRWELGRVTPPSDWHFALAVIDVLNPNDTERRLLFKLITGVEAPPEEFGSDADRREAMLNTLGHMRRQAKHIAELLNEQNEKIDLLESYLLEDSLRQGDSAPEETTPNR